MPCVALTHVEQLPSVHSLTVAELFAWLITLWTGNCLRALNTDIE